MTTDQPPQTAAPPSRLAHIIAGQLFQAGLLDLKSGHRYRAAQVIQAELTRDVECAVCSMPCCPWCAWDYGLKRYECPSCEESTKDTPDVAKSHGK